MTLKVTQKPRKQNLGLTVSQATSQARRIVNRIMPGAGATVDSRNCWDQVADVQVVITTVTFPAIIAATVKTALYIELATLAGNVRQTNADSSVTITRTIR